MLKVTSVVLVFTIFLNSMVFGNETHDTNLEKIYTNIIASRLGLDKLNDNDFEKIQKDLESNSLEAYEKLDQISDDDFLKGAREVTTNLSQEDFFQFNDDEKNYIASNLDEETLLLSATRDEAISLSVKTHLENRTNFIKTYLLTKGKEGVKKDLLKVNEITKSKKFNYKYLITILVGILIVAIAILLVYFGAGISAIFASPVGIGYYSFGYSIGPISIAVTKSFAIAVQAIGWISLVAGAGTTVVGSLGVGGRYFAD